MIIAIVVLVIFGAKKVPELMKGVGTGIKEFKKASRDVQDARAVYDAAKKRSMWVSVDFRSTSATAEWGRRVT